VDCSDRDRLTYLHLGVQVRALVGSVYGWNDSHWFPYCSSVWLAISAKLFCGK